MQHGVLEQLKNSNAQNLVPQNSIMARDPPAYGDALDELRETTDAFHTMEKSRYPGRYPSDHDYPVRYEGNLSQESFQDFETALSGPETIELARETVEVARQGVQQSLAGSEPFGEAIHMSLTVDLSHRTIRDVPDEVVNILKGDVERLLLSHNQIWHIPYKFSECTALTYLNLRDNRLKDVPKALFKLPTLTILDLSRNKLSRVPEDIRSMRSLRVVSLMHNQLQTLPVALGFLESVRVLKLANNPWKDGLKGIVDGVDGSPSPLVVPLAENQKEAMVTLKVKQYLKAEAASLESGGESSSESPLDTPRPLKRNTSLRFPVVPTTSGSESAPDLKSPGLFKPPVPSRSHYRVASGPNSTLQLASLRRPGVTPLIIGNERNRSNSESVLQATQHTRSKRMGIITRKNSDLGTVDETRTNRNSYHYRGYSHSSTLRDKHNGVISPIENERKRGTFVHRLSSLPEHKRDSYPANNIIEGARGALYSMHLVHPHIGCLLPLLRDGMSKRTSLERVYYNATTHIERLDQELQIYDSNEGDGSQQRKGQLENVRVVCRAAIVAYQQAVSLLLRSVSQLVLHADQRYIRTLILLVYGSSIEARNACINLGKSPCSLAEIRNDKPVIPVICEEQSKMSFRSITPTKERPNPIRRLRSETTMNQTVANTARRYGHMKSATNPNSTVPLYLNNGRSRSNSRTTTLSSTSSSVANTPRSGESFLIPGTPLNARSDSLLSTPGATEFDQDALFEKIYLAFKEAARAGLQSLPLVYSQFSNNLANARDRYASDDLLERWQVLVSRCQNCQELCEILKTRLSTIVLKEPEQRNSSEFWKSCTRYGNSFVRLMDDVKEAKKLGLITHDVSRLLLPVHRTTKTAVNSITNSPWEWVLVDNAPPQQTPGQSQSSQWHTNGRANVQNFTNGHHRTRGGSGSSSLNFPTSVPATPLSAALGPAAQATVPSKPAASTLMDRSFQGDVFQRAESYLNMQQSMHYRR